MERVKVIQFGTTHEHAIGKMATLRKRSDIFEVVGVVDDRHIQTTRWPHGTLDKVFEGVPFLTEEEAFARKDVELACVEVPNLELVRWGMKCAERNLPMHLDKPAGDTFPEYEILVKECKKRNLPLQMGYMFRGNPVFQFCARLVKEGILGDLFQVDMDMNFGYGGEAYQEYIAQLKGGIMLNLGCHLVDYVVELMGEPERVIHFQKHTGDVPEQCHNNTLAVLEYPRATAVLRVCGRYPGMVEARQARIAGTNGYFVFSPLERFDGKPVVLTMHLKNARGGFCAGPWKMEFPPQKDRYEEQLLELVSVIREGKLPRYSYEHDLLVHKISLQTAGLH